MKLSRSEISEYVSTLVEDEITKVRKKYKPYNSDHELYAVLQEEVDEFWDEVKKNGTYKRKTEELVQIIAVAKRGLEEIILHEMEDRQKLAKVL